MQDQIIGLQARIASLKVEASFLFGIKKAEKNTQIRECQQELEKIQCNLERKKPMETAESILAESISPNFLT